MLRPASYHQNRSSAGHVTAAAINPHHHNPQHQPPIDADTFLQRQHHEQEEEQQATVAATTTNAASTNNNSSTAETPDAKYKERAQQINTVIQQHIYRAPGFPRIGELPRNIADLRVLPVAVPEKCEYATTRIVITLEQYKWPYAPEKMFKVARDVSVAVERSGSPNAWTSLRFSRRGDLLTHCVIDFLSPNYAGVVMQQLTTAKYVVHFGVSMIDPFSAVNSTLLITDFQKQLNGGEGISERDLLSAFSVEGEDNGFRDVSVVPAFEPGIFYVTFRTTASANAVLHNPMFSRAWFLFFLRELGILISSVECDDKNAFRKQLLRYNEIQQQQPGHSNNNRAGLLDSDGEDGGFNPDDAGNNNNLDDDEDDPFGGFRRKLGAADGDDIDFNVEFGVSVAQQQQQQQNQQQSGADSTRQEDGDQSNAVVARRDVGVLDAEAQFLQGAGGDEDAAEALKKLGLDDGTSNSNNNAASTANTIEASFVIRRATGPDTAGMIDSSSANTTYGYALQQQTQHLQWMAMMNMNGGNMMMMPNSSSRTAMPPPPGYDQALEALIMANPAGLVLPSSSDSNNNNAGVAGGIGAMQFQDFSATAAAPSSANNNNDNDKQSATSALVQQLYQAINLDDFVRRFATFTAAALEAKDYTTIAQAFTRPPLFDPTLLPLHNRERIHRYGATLCAPFANPHVLFALLRVPGGRLALTRHWLTAPQLQTGIAAVTLQLLRGSSSSSSDKKHDDASSTNDKSATAATTALTLDPIFYDLFRQWPPALTSSLLQAALPQRMADIPVHCRDEIKDIVDRRQQQDGGDDSDNNNLLQHLPIFALLLKDEEYTTNLTALISLASAEHQTLLGQLLLLSKNTAATIFGGISLATFWIACADATGVAQILTAASACHAHVLLTPTLNSMLRFCYPPGRLTNNSNNSNNSSSASTSNPLVNGATDSQWENCVAVLEGVAGVDVLASEAEVAWIRTLVADEVHDFQRIVEALKRMAPKLGRRAIHVLVDLAEARNKAVHDEKMAQRKAQLMGGRVAADDGNDNDDADADGDTAAAGGQLSSSSSSDDDVNADNDDNEAKNNEANNKKKKEDKKTSKVKQRVFPSAALESWRRINEARAQRGGAGGGATIGGGLYQGSSASTHRVPGAVSLLSAPPLLSAGAGGVAAPLLPSAPRLVATAGARPGMVSSSSLYHSATAPPLPTSSSSSSLLPGASSLLAAPPPAATGFRPVANLDTTIATASASNNDGGTAPVFPDHESAARYLSTLPPTWDREFDRYPPKGGPFPALPPGATAHMSASHGLYYFKTQVTSSSGIASTNKGYRHPVTRREYKPTPQAFFISQAVDSASFARNNRLEHARVKRWLADQSVRDAVIDAIVICSLNVKYPAQLHGVGADQQQQGASGATLATADGLARRRSRSPRQQQQQQQEMPPPPEPREPFSHEALARWFRGYPNSGEPFPPLQNSNNNNNNSKWKVELNKDDGFYQFRNLQTGQVSSRHPATGREYRATPQAFFDADKEKSDDVKAFCRQAGVQILKFRAYLRDQKERDKEMDEALIRELGIKY